MQKIEFVKSPTGAFKLGYHVGDVVEIEDQMANTLIEAKFAIPARKPEAKTSEVIPTDYSKMLKPELQAELEKLGHDHKGMKVEEMVAFLTDQKK